MLPLIACRFRIVQSFLDVCTLLEAAGVGLHEGGYTRIVRRSVQELLGDKIIKKTLVWTPYAYEDLVSSISRLVS